VKRAVWTWFVVAALGTALGALAGSGTFYTMYSWSWRFRLGAQVALAIGAPVLAAVWLTVASVRARMLPGALMAWAVTLACAWTALPALRDLRSGPFAGRVHVARSESVATDAFRAHFTDGRAFDYDSTIDAEALTNVDADVVALDHKGLLLEVVGAKHADASPFPWTVAPVLWLLCMPALTLALRAGRRRAFVAAAVDPRDGRRWVRGRFVDGTGGSYRDSPGAVPLTVYVATRTKQWREQTFEPISELATFGWSPARVRIETPDGALDVDLSNAWYAVHAEPDEQRFAEGILRRGGFEPVEKDDAGVREARFTGRVSNDPHVRVWRRRFGADEQLDVCGVVDGQTVAARGAGRPLIVVEGHRKQREHGVARLALIGLRLEVGWWLGFALFATVAFLYTFSGIMETHWRWLS
jgi:hypothetical protein